MSLRFASLNIAAGAIVLALILSFESSGSAETAQPEADAVPHRIFVMSNGWHSNIIMARPDITPGRIPEIVDFLGAEYLEFGWGDAEYYPAKRTTFGMTMRAAFTSTPAVMHVLGSFRHPKRRYPTAEVIELAVDKAGLEKLVQFIHESFDRNRVDRAKISNPGLYANSLFYPATGRFHLGNTCNSWTARALNAAGFDVDSAAAAPASDLMLQLRQLAKAP